MLANGILSSSHQINSEREAREAGEFVLAAAAQMATSPILEVTEVDSSDVLCLFLTVVVQW